MPKPKCHCGNPLPCHTHTGTEGKIKEDYGKTALFRNPRENEPKYGTGHDNGDDMFGSSDPYKN